MVRSTCCSGTVTAPPSRPTPRTPTRTTRGPAAGASSHCAACGDTWRWDAGSGADACHCQISHYSLNNLGIQSGDCYCFNNSLQNHPRSRYSGWLGEAYNRSETVVRSTDVDRTLMSAQVRQLCKYFLLQQNIFSLTWLACTRRRPSRWWRPGWGGSRCRCTRCRRPRTISSPATPTVPGAPPTVSI